MVTTPLNIELIEIKNTLQNVFDPEIPVLTVLDLGVIKNIQVEGKNVKIELTPTYSGCPAMDFIASDISNALAQIGYTTTIKTVLSPAWSTDWISEEGRKKMEEYGIAAPLEEQLDKKVLLNGGKILKCPQCGSSNTKMISQFGSTACKALFRCDDCLEPFDYFKCLK